MTTPAPTDQPGGGAGLDLFRFPLACGYAWGHPGSLAGYETRVLANRDGRHIVFLAVNAWGPRSLIRQVDSVAEYACQS